MKTLEKIIPLTKNEPFNQPDKINPSNMTTTSPVFKKLRWSETSSTSSKTETNKVNSQKILEAKSEPTLDSQKQERWSKIN